jgi:hypothetical protein
MRRVDWLTQRDTSNVSRSFFYLPPMMQHEYERDTNERGRNWAIRRNMEKDWKKLLKLA